MVKPRYKKILNTIKRFGSCCDPLLSQATGLTRAWDTAKEMAAMGLLRWTRRKRFGKYNNHRPPGWTLTEKGKELQEALLVKWTFEDTLECYKQGWAPFNTDDGTTQIFALDDPHGVAADYGFVFKGHYFKGKNRDGYALRYVKRKAAKGDDLCKRALQLCIKNQFVGDTLPFMD